MISLADFPHVVIITTPVRWPAGYNLVARQLRAKGVGRIFGMINGRESIDDPLPDEVAAVGYWADPPATFEGRPGSWYQLKTFKQLVKMAILCGVDSLLIAEDDVILTPECDATLAAVDAPDDWELIYFGGQHGKDCTERLSPHLLRCKGGTLANHLVAYRASIFDQLLALPETMPVDCGLSDVIQPCGWSYVVWPPAAVQAPGISTITGEMGGWSFLYDKSGVPGED